MLRLARVLIFDVVVSCRTVVRHGTGEVEQGSVLGLSRLVGSSREGFLDDVAEHANDDSLHQDNFQQLCALRGRR